MAKNQVNFFPFLKELVIGSVVAEKWKTIIHDKPQQYLDLLDSLEQTILLQGFWYNGQGENVYIPGVAHSQGIVVDPSLLRYGVPVNRHPGNSYKYFLG